MNAPPSTAASAADDLLPQIHLLALIGELHERLVDMSGLPDHPSLRDLASILLPLVTATEMLSELVDRDELSSRAAKAIRETEGGAILVTRMLESEDELEEAIGRLRRGELIEGAVWLERAIPALAGLVSLIEKRTS